MKKEMKQFEPMRIALSKLVKADWNYKPENSFMEEKLTANLKKNGQIETLLVRELESGLFEVINGNHRLTPMMRLGFEDALVINVGPVSKQAAMRLAIEVNETRFRNDEEILAQNLKELVESYGLDDLGETLPYHDGEVADLIASLDFDLKNITGKQKSGKSDATLTFTMTKQMQLRWNRVKKQFKDMTDEEVFDVMLKERLKT